MLPRMMTSPSVVPIWSGQLPASAENTRVTVTVRRDVLKRAERQVKRGKAKSVSAWIDSAMEEKARREDLAALLAEMRAENGPPRRRRTGVVSYLAASVARAPLRMLRMASVVLYVGDRVGLESLPLSADRERTRPRNAAAASVHGTRLGGVAATVRRYASALVPRRRHSSWT